MRTIDFVSLHVLIYIIAIGFFSFALTQLPLYFLPAEFPPAMVGLARAVRRVRFCISYYLNIHTDRLQQE